MKTFVIVEPQEGVCQFMVEILKRFLKDRAKVVDFLSFDEAWEKIPSISEVAMIFVAFDAPTERGGRVAQKFKRQFPDAKIILTSVFDFHEKAEQLGLDDFVSKIDFVSIGKLEQLLQKHGIEL